VSQGQRTLHHAAEAARWSLLLLLVALGVYAAVVRALIYAGHPWALAESLRASSTGLFPAHAAGFQQLEDHFVRSGPRVFAHVVTGALFLVAGLLQFSARIRARRPRLHRLSGWALVTLGSVIGTTGVWMGVVDPFSTGERIPAVLIGVVFLVAPSRAIAAIRRGDVARHREWMIRFYAVGLSIVTIRLLGAPTLWLLAPITVGDALTVTFWAGWLLTQLVAELWIRWTRVHRLVPAVALRRVR
jgi:uncharacterized membrane protein